MSRDCLKRVYTLGLAWRLTGKRPYAERAKREILNVCAFKDWNPSHFLDTAEMSHAVGVGYDWLYSGLSEDDRKTIRAGLIKNGMKPGLKAYGLGRDKAAWWTRSEFNWNQVCNSGLAIGSLAIAETDPEYAKEIVPRAVKSLPKAIASYAPDGAWGEGPGYWNYATNYTVYGIEAMRTALGTDYGLAKMKGFAEAGLFPLYGSGPSMMWLHYADCGENSSRRNSPLFFWFAREAGCDLLAADEIAMMKKRGAVPLDVIWYHPPRAGRRPALPLDRLFGGPVEVALFRSAWDDPQALFVGLKAGYNQVNHGHLDLGNFEVEALGVRWARDLGSDNYNLPDYWSKGRGGTRWKYYRLNSQSHNVPLLDGENQDPYGKSKFVKFKAAPERSTRPSGHEAFGIVDMTSAYPKKATKVLRGVKVLAGRRAVLVQDELALTKTCEVAWGMTTDAKIETRGNHAALTLKGELCRALILTPKGAAFTVESAERKAPEKTNRGVRRLVIRLADQSGGVRVAVLLAPAWPGGGKIRAPKVEPLAQWK
ncbi:MAG: heparinase II/III domain-containing protein [Planctomycetota bacterium]